MTAIPITLEPDAFAHLSSARTYESESWSDVVRRAVWSDSRPARRGADILEYMKTRTEFLDDEALDLIEAVDRSDRPPTNPWNGTHGMWIAAAGLAYSMPVVTRNEDDSNGCHISE